MARLQTRLRRQAERCATDGSPLTAALLCGAADDLERGGVVADLLGTEERAPSGSVPALRLAGALHRLVLEGRVPELAAFYPSAGGAAAPADVWPAAERALRAHLAELRSAVLRPVQTNEPGRATLLLGGLLVLARDWPLPVRLLEVGASAGLNLHPDRYAHEVAGGVTLGDPASPVRVPGPWQGRLPPLGATPRIVERAGCDLRPLDPRSPADRLTLTSYVWADQKARLDRLRAALRVAAAHPVTVEALSASAFLDRELATPRPGLLTVVWQSVVQQYLDPEEAARLARAVEVAGRRARPDAPLAWLAMEPERVGGPSGVPFLLHLTTWPGGRSRTLARCHGHGPPVVWADTGQG